MVLKKIKTLNTNNTVLLIIDIQEKLLNAVFNKNTLIKKLEILTKASKILNIPTIVTEQYPKGLGETIAIIKDNLPENFYFFEKTDFNALKNPQLIKILKQIKHKSILLIGIETHICVYQTAIALANAGYDVTVISDVCGSRAEEEYNNALDVIKTFGINVKTTEMILFELLKGSKNTNFKKIQSLIK